LVVAASVAGLPVITAVGGLLSVTVIEVVAVMVIAAVLALTLESSATVAVMTTAAGGIVAGAV
jgi:hypothetical protein